MNRLTTEKRAQVIRALVEGTSIRATVRMTGVAKNTIVRLLAEVGEACASYQDSAFHDLRCQRIQCDEIWSFVYAKKKNVPETKIGQAGDVWTWVALDADTKLVPCWLLSPTRELDAAIAFLSNLAARLRNRIQLTSDGHHVYAEAVDFAFAGEVDFAQLIKVYRGAQTDASPETRYSPASVTGIRSRRVFGNPDRAHVSTSYVERQNLTMRMQMRRFTRLTNGFSKKLANHIAAVALHFMYYNFCRIHQTLRITPAMAAGVSDRLWDVEDIVALVEAKEHESVAATAN